MRLVIKAAVPLAAGAQTTQANRHTADAEQTAPKMDVCGSGLIWEPAGYSSHGKWQPMHCAPHNLQLNW
jgi:hypothetical protein